MKIILDANIICSDYWFNSSNSKLFLEGLKVLPAELLVPEVVIDEVINKYGEDLTSKMREAHKQLSEYGRLANEKEFLSPNIEVGGLIAKYKTTLLKILAEAKARITPYPEVSHKEVVERELSRKKPFNTNGSGYRDYLIWLSVKQMANGSPHDKVFLTNNARDFGEGPELHKDFQEDIFNSHRLKIVNSLKQFNEKYVIHKLEARDEIRLQLQENAVGFFDVHEWLQKNLLESLWGNNLESIVLGFPEGTGQVYPSKLLQLKDIEIIEVFELTSKEKIVKTSVKAEIEFSVSIDWEDYTVSQEVRELVGEDADPFSWLHTSAIEEMEIGLNFTLTAAPAPKVRDEIAKITGPNGILDFNLW